MSWRPARWFFAYHGPMLGYAIRPTCPARACEEENVVFETERLILRPWEDEDAESLYEYAKDPEVGPIAGWPPHTSVEYSGRIIRDVLSADETYAVCLREDNRAIGSIGLISPMQSHTEIGADELEVGYWIGVPFWGRGIVPEAAGEILRHAFGDLKLNRVWCGYYDGNEKSKRVQEKLGFKYQWTTEDVDVPLMHETRTGHVSLMTKEDWENAR